MKTYVYRYKTGLYSAVQSFGLAWRHKALLAYTLCASGASFLATVILYNALNLSYPDTISPRLLLKEALCALNPACNAEIDSMIILAFTSFIVLVISNYFIVGLYHHAAHIWAGEQRSFGEALKKGIPKLPRITIWGLIALCVEQAAVMTSNLSSSFLQASALVIFISIHLATFFVLPLIAYTNESIKGIVILSYKVAKNRFIEIVGGGTWFAIVASFFFIPTAFFWGYWQTSQHLKSGAVIIIVGLLQLGIRIFLSTSFNLFRGLIYTDYHRENPTLEEMYRFPWPQM